MEEEKSKSLWSRIQASIQIVGLTIAVGALFLNIPTPSSAGAQEALRNLQFLWLIIIGICLLYLGLLCIASLLWLEEKATKRLKVNLEQTASLIFFVLVGFMLYNLGKYTYAIYGEELVLGLYVLISAAALVLYTVLDRVITRWTWRQTKFIPLIAIPQSVVFSTFLTAVVALWGTKYIAQLTTPYALIGVFIVFTVTMYGLKVFELVFAEQIYRNRERIHPLLLDFIFDGKITNSKSSPKENN